MPVTSFALLVCSVIAAAALTVWAVSAWGMLTMLPLFLFVVVLARWGLAHVPYDDHRT
ncbi:hypothetical protein [Tropicibacter naphthalenivorans]|uniref:Uncharacterized protein n=1 Tax=Tropicibacter naphthalenivorans TaxID=441103 RepID=A0A0N7LZ76_9RHOB|nr:hypothetical protein [Tropicibacter naphthalenivorans]CUH76889.1 hypothetical protein TRN7648_01176 [Tropicibacter naphthalenivorans]SMC62494.1 hypothetical protein SAMN04488093_102442 [Tropicibacter naphthalenivorans]